jgi:succinate dehydrogenase / fumarate reductase membrane anchor subunit
MSLRSPLGRVRGLGSAKSGVGHFIAQRLTAIALVPLSLWFVISVIGHVGATYESLHAWLASPTTVTLLVLLIAVGVRHATIGLQVVIEDYVHIECRRIVWLVAAKFAVIFFGVLSAVSVIRVAFVGG